LSYPEAYWAYPQVRTMIMSKSRPPKTRIRLLLTGLLALFLMIAIIPRAQTVYDLKQQKNQLELQKARLSEENSRLQEAMLEANSPETVERIAREELGLVKKGETIIIPVLSE